jgi:CspA family cold shock protein
MVSAGTIKKFFEDKGFGFITPDDGGEDVFAHVKECPELEGAQAGDAVNYDTKYDDRKGKYNATNLSVSGGGGGGGGGDGGGKGKGGGKDKGYSPW